jgi:hypothetical protein
MGKSHKLLVAVPVCLVMSALLIASCSNYSALQPDPQTVIDAVSGFLDACGNLQLDTVRSFFSQDYLSTNEVPDPITEGDLFAAMGDLSSYRLDPASDVSLQGDQAIATPALDIAGKGEKTETLIMKLEEGAWKVDSFTAMDWSSKPHVEPTGDAQAEQALSDFVVSCIDGKTDTVFANLSSGYKKKYHLDKAWTSAEFSGIFGTARSYDFDPQGISVEDGRAAVNVTIEFGTRGNLQPETARVELVKEGGNWLIDIFPFFIL